MGSNAQLSDSLSPIGHEYVTDRGEEGPYPAQCDGYTCGIAALAAFSARASRSARASLSSRGALADEAARPPFGRYLALEPAQVERVQKDAHRVASQTGLPWPRALGTSPWALAILASRATGMRYIVRPWSAGTALLAQRVNEAGHDVFAYVGERLIPRHVVLLLGDAPRLGWQDPLREQFQDQSQAIVRIFEPSIGRIFMTDRREIPRRWSGRDRKAHWGWWTRPLLAVLPAPHSDASPDCLGAAGCDSSGRSVSDVFRHKTPLDASS